MGNITFSLEDRLIQLEMRVKYLEGEVQALKERLGHNWAYYDSATATWRKPE